MTSGPTVHKGSGTSAGSPSGSQTESQSRSMVHFCVSRRVRERVARGQKKIKREKKKKKSFFPHKAHHFRPYWEVARVEFLECRVQGSRYAFFGTSGF